MWGDILLQANGTLDYKTFGSDQFVRYLKYVTMQAGLNGLFTERSAREIIEGYHDFMIQELSTRPMWQGGDSTNPTFLSLN